MQIGSLSTNVSGFILGLCTLLLFATGFFLYQKVGAVEQDISYNQNVAQSVIGGNFQSLDKQPVVHKHK